MDLGISIDGLFSLYFILINLIGLVQMYRDKRFACNHRWRISEQSLLGIAFLGGAIGIWFGMAVFHHKTRKRKFILLVPGLACIQGMLMYYLWIS